MDISLETTLSREQILPVPDATISYWRTQPHDIDEYRSSEQLPTECDIAILGTGMAGVSTAYQITKLMGPRKPSIVMLEARQVCSGATGRNGGHVKLRSLTMQTLVKRHGVVMAEEIAAFVNEQIYALKEVVEAEGIDCEFELRRSYDVFIDQKEAEEATRFFREGVKAKAKWVRNVDLVGQKYVERVTSVKGAKAALSKPACSLWPYKFVTGLLAKLVAARDIELHTWTPVTAVEESKEGQFSVLRTPRGATKARQVVFATNAYMAGICDQYLGKIVPTKSTACHISPAHDISPHLSHTYNISYSHFGATPCVDYLNPRPDGGIVVGGANWMYERARNEWYNNWDDSRQLPGVRAHFDGLMQRYFAGWQDSGAVVDHLWTGIIGRTADEEPYVGEVHKQETKQYIIAGFNGGGMAYIFLCARGLAQMIVNRVPYAQTGLPRLFEARQDRMLQSVCSTLPSKDLGELLVD